MSARAHTSTGRSPLYLLLCKYKCSLRESIRELSRTAPESPLRMIYCCIQKGPIPVPPTETAAAPTKNPTNTDHRSAPQEGSALQKIDAPIYTWCALSIANQSTTLQSTGADTMQLKKKTANIQLSWNALTPSMALSIVELSTELPGRIRT